MALLKETLRRRDKKSHRDAFCIVAISKYVFVGCPEQADVEQVSGDGMQVCLDTGASVTLCLIWSH